MSELADPQIALNALLARLKPDEGAALKAKLAMIRLRRERIQAKAHAEADRGSLLSLNRVWDKIRPAAEEAREEMIQAAFDTNVSDDDLLITYIRDEFAHFLGSAMVSYGQSLTNRQLGATLHQVAGFVAHARQAAAVAESLVRSRRWDAQSKRSVAQSGLSKLPTIVLVTVNDHETQAIFDEFLGTRPVPAPTTRGGVTYTVLGSYGDAQVVHTTSEMSTLGVGASQHRTQQALEHWSAKAVIAVGIAYGMDEMKQEIGDVLVATQVLECEVGRVNPDGSITYRGPKVPASDRLLSRLRYTQAARKRGALSGQRCTSDWS